MWIIGNLTFCKSEEYLQLSNQQVIVKDETESWFGIFFSPEFV
jgi:hypothetical protein